MTERQVKLFVLSEFGKYLEDSIWPALKAAAFASGNVEVARADQVSFAAHVTDNMKEAIGGADIVLAVLGIQPSANVLLELGVALATNKPTILLVSNPESIPSVLLGHRYVQYDASGARSETLKKRLTEVLQHAVELSRRKRLEEEFAECFEATILTRMPRSELQRALRDARRTFRCVLTEPSDAATDLLRSLPSVAPSHLRVQVAWLDPESDTAARIARDRGYNVAHFRQDARRAIFKALDLFASRRKYSEIRLFDFSETPDFLQIDDELFLTVLSQSGHSRGGLLARLNMKHQAVEDALEAAFQRTWSRSVSVGNSAGVLGSATQDDG